MPAATRARRFLPAATVLAVAALAAGGFWWSQRRPAGAPPGAAPTAAVNATNPPGPAAKPNPGFEKLKGKWLRPDGGYVVEVRGVESSGKLDATYSNPRPIHVANAEAAQDGGTVKVFIELRDVGYPGCTYNLAYDPENDQLAGIYYQAAIQQRFEVVFVRMK